MSFISSTTASSRGHQTSVPQATHHAKAWPWCRSIAFALAFLVAVVLGRATVMDGTSLSLVWPAAGIAVVWFLSQRNAPTTWFDWGALALITFFVNSATGAGPVLASCFVVANIVQIVVFKTAFSRWCPELWGAGGTAQLKHVRQLWRLTAAALVATAAASSFGPTAVGIITGEWSVVVFVVWMTRNSASIMLIAVVGLRLGASMHRRRTGQAAEPEPRPSHLELVAVIVVSLGAYAITFGYANGLPLAFLMISITVWVGTRFSVTFTAVHDLLVGVIAVLLTLQGLGPFAAIESDAVRALVVQSFILLTAVTALSLAVLRDERDALMRTVARQAQDAADHSRLIGVVMDSMQEGVLAMDASGTVLLRNVAATQLLGGVRSDTGQVRETDYYGITAIDGSRLEHDDIAHVRAMRGERVLGQRIRVKNPGVPQGRVLEVTANPLPLQSISADHHETPNQVSPTSVSTKPAGNGAVIVYHDATAAHERESEMAQFATVVAHDLRGPLAGLRGWLELATDSAAEELGEAHGAALERRQALVAVLGRAERSVVQLDQLITDLLDHAVLRRATLRAEPLDLAAVVHEVLDVHHGPAVNANQLHATTDLPQNLPRILADPVLIQQLLANLVGNAVKYVRPGHDPHVDISAFAKHGSLHVMVADQGIGIPAGQHQRIFDDLYRAHAGYTGSGLGLALCRRIVERHGGTIAAGDNPGGGARISFMLPISAG